MLRRANQEPEPTFGLRLREAWRDHHSLSRPSRVLLSKRSELCLRNAAGFLTQINALRASAGMAAATETATSSRTALENLLFRERGFWLYATAHRLGDMRRLLSAPYNRPFNTVFPVGEYFKGGGNYGTDANLPVPFDERNNPNFTGCQNRNR